MSEPVDRENEGVQLYHHQFTEHELNQMLYYWDEEADPVVEYHYLKRAWMQQSNETSNTTNADDGEEDYAYLNLDTTSEAHVVEFYSHNCPHCHRLKEHYIELAYEMKHRSIVTPINFHAVSCGLYPMICRAYDIHEHPFVMGFAVGMPSDEPGLELNPHGDNTKLTEENIALALNIELTPPGEDLPLKDITQMDNQDEVQEQQVAIVKKSWHEFSSQTIHDRFHNAGVTLASILHTAIQSRQLHGSSHTNERWLDLIREQALFEFLRLVDWATPVEWSVRRGLIQELLDQWSDAMENHLSCLDVLKRHQSTERFGDVSNNAHIKGASRKRRLGRSSSRLDENDQGHMRVVHSKDQKNISIQDANSKWTEACTHGQRGAGFSCGLWDLLHIISIGSSFPRNQLYGYNRGYWVAPQQIGLVIKSFLFHFFTCKVCRQHFIENYESCGQNHCHRLAAVLPHLSQRDGGSKNSRQSEEESATVWGRHRALALWLFEFHNVVNVRLMKESAMEYGRDVTNDELLAAIFPTKSMCPACWLPDHDSFLLNDTTLISHYDPDKVFNFLKGWYWYV